MTNVLSASLTVRDDLIKSQQIIWGYYIIDYQIRFGCTKQLILLVVLGREGLGPKFSTCSGLGWVSLLMCRVGSTTLGFRPAVTTTTTTRGVAGCGPHRAALARGGKRAKIVFFLNSRENSDCNFMCVCVH